MEVFAVMDDGELWNRYWDHTYWHQWETLGGELCGAVPVFAQHALGEVAEEGIGVFGSARFGGRWTSYLSASSFVVFLDATIGFVISGVDGAARRAGS